MTSQKQPLPSVKGFDSEKSGRVAECDGGRMLPGTRFAGREEFTGTLTGDFVDHGEPPWRWYLDAHSLWHAATVPLGFLWYSFLSDDAYFLEHHDESPEKGA